MSSLWRRADSERIRLSSRRRRRRQSYNYGWASMYTTRSSRITIQAIAMVKEAPCIMPRTAFAIRPGDSSGTICSAATSVGRHPKLLYKRQTGHRFMLCGKNRARRQSGAQGRYACLQAPLIPGGSKVASFLAATMAMRPPGTLTGQSRRPRHRLRTGLSNVSVCLSGRTCRFH